MAAIDRNDRPTMFEPPTGRVRAVLDTDTYNEVDDQFALAYALLSPERISLEAVYAAPFLNQRSVSAADGMQKSYEEAREVVKLLADSTSSSEGLVLRGAESFLTEKAAPVPTEATRDLIARAGDGERLYVISIGAITNIATALLLEPSIAENLTVVWLGGHQMHLPESREFNLEQDPTAVRAVFDSGVAMVRIPCAYVASHMLTSIPELREHIGGANAISDFLLARFEAYATDSWAWTKEIWDLAAVAYVVNPDWVPTALVHQPHLGEDLRLSHDYRRPLYREAISVNRDAVFADLFRKLTKVER